MPFDDFVLTVDTKSRRRSASTSGPISGSVEGFDLSGSYAVESEQSLQIEAQRSSFVDDRLHVKVRLSAAGESATAVVDVRGSYDPPLSWFLDSAALDTLPDGFSETVNPSGDFTGTVTISETGFPTETTSVDERVTGSEKWTVAQHVPSMNVLGTEYSDIVRVDRRASVPDPLTGTPTPTTIVYWVARGVGIIRAENVMRFLSTPLVWELMATNLVPNGAGDDGTGGAGGA